MKEKPGDGETREAKRQLSRQMCVSIDEISVVMSDKKSHYSSNSKQDRKKD